MTTSTECLTQYTCLTELGSLHHPTLSYWWLILFSAGHEDDPLQFIEGVMDEVICMPGTTTMNTKTEIRWYHNSDKDSQKSFSKHFDRKNIIMIYTFFLLLNREDLPSDLMMKLDLKKIDPFPMTVPCLDGVGSCDYDICQIITDMGATVCDHFPEGQPCGCPLLKVKTNIEG